MTIQDIINQYGIVEDWNIHSNRIEKPEIRRAVYDSVPEALTRKPYAQPESVGYNAALVAPNFGAVAFIPRNADGSDGAPVFDW